MESRLRISKNGKAYRVPDDAEEAGEGALGDDEEPGSLTCTHIINDLRIRSARAMNC